MLGLRYREVIFSESSYCGQVRTVAAAALFIGLHGQGLTNGVFLSPTARMVELFSPALGPVSGLGHQPLALATGINYLGLQLAETSLQSRQLGCSRRSELQWKFDPRCTRFECILSISISHVLHRM